MERHLLIIRPDHGGWVLLDGERPLEWFHTRRGAIAIGEVRAYALHRWTGVPTALAVFVDDTASTTELQYG